MMSQVTMTFTFASENDALAFLSRNTPTVAADPTARVLTDADAAADLAGTPRPDNPTVPAKAAATSKPAKPAKAAAAAAPAEAPAPAPAPAPAAAPTVEYPTLQKAVFELAAKNKPAVTALLAEMGIESFKSLKPEQYADALAKVQAKAAEIEVA